jgi:phosphohistidine phosphatase
MHLALLRHGLAQEREPGATAAQDALRQLTDEGRRRVRRGSRALAELLPHLDALATSSLPRAAETAELAAECYANLKPIVLPALEPGGSREELSGWLAAQRADSAVLLVGHSPDLEEFAGWLLAGVAEPFVRLGKGGALLLRIESSPGPACAELLWSLPARTLRALVSR